MSHLYRERRGFSVRVRRRDLPRSTYFSASKYGGLRNAERAARAYLRGLKVPDDPTYRTRLVAKGAVYRNGGRWVAYLRHRGKNYTKSRTAEDAGAEQMLLEWLADTRRVVADKHNDELEEDVILC
jgi:IS5 family transposase